MVWFQYRLDAINPEEDGSVMRSPGTPKSPKQPPYKLISEDDAINLYFFMKQVCYDGIYDHCVLNTSEFNSFAVQDLINSKRFHEDFDYDHFKYWAFTYREFLKRLREYTILQLTMMGKSINIPRKLFERFVYHYSDGYITHF